MADFKLRAPPRLRFHGLASFDGVFGTGGAIALAGDAVARAVGQAALLRGINLAGAGVASSQATSALLKGLRLSSAAQAGAVGSSTLSAFGGAWNVGPINLLVGASGLPAGQYSAASTGPSGYTVGGVYGIDPAGTQLPSGMTMTEAGLADVGSAAAGTTTGVVATYAEPGAFPLLTLHPSTTATLPYMATWYPPEGVVPASYNVQSPDDANLRGSVIATWPDSSAQIIVLAGETALTNGVTKGIRLRTGQPSAGTALTTARIAAVVSSVKVNFGGGEQTLSSFGAPDRVWWANSRVICARYRLGCGVGVMEAVIDIHAFAGGVSDRAFVEVVIENGRLNSASPSVPATQSYTGATVKVNDVTVATVSSPSASMAFPNAKVGGTYTGGHEPFRAWYCAAWVNGGSVSVPGGAADPQIIVTHDAVSMRRHPMFFEQAESNTVNLTTSYAFSYDTYVPWSPQRVRVPGMGGGGEYDEIALFTTAQSHYFQTGDKNAARAVVNHALGVLCCTVNYRDSSTNLVPSVADMAGKSGTNSTWPVTGSNFSGFVNTEPRFEEAHQPAHGLVAFMCRPSPCFIEIAHKISCWNVAQADSGSGNGRHPYDQVRSRAWRMRNYGHALFVTPDDLSAWKFAQRTMIVSNDADFYAFLDLPWNTLGVIWGTTPSDWNSYADYSRARWQTPMWQTDFLVMAVSQLADSKLCRGADQTRMETLANRLSLPVVRQINETTTGEWRAIPYAETIGDVTTAVPYGPSNWINMSPGTWDGMRRSDFTGTPPAATGGWLFLDSDKFAWSDGVVETSAGYTYASQFWGAFCAAVERGVSGADSAWDRVVTSGGLANLATWRQGFRTDPRFNRWPRNK